MDFTWIVVGLAGWALALVFVLLLMRMASRQDRAARHGEKALHPFSDVTITKIGKSKLKTPDGGGSANALSAAPTATRTPAGNRAQAAKDLH